MPALSGPPGLAANLVSGLAANTSVLATSNSSVGSRLTPNSTQKVTLIVAACYVVAIGILWFVDCWQVTPKYAHMLSASLRMLPYILGIFHSYHGYVSHSYSSSASILKDPEHSSLVYPFKYAQLPRCHPSTSVLEG